MRKILIFLIILFLPKKIKPILLKYLGLSIHPSAKIGTSFFLADNLVMEANSRIGSFNIFKGPFSVVLLSKGVIGNFNKFLRARSKISYGYCVIKLGFNTIISSYHHLDLTRSIIFKDNSIVAGINSQLWTHGYVHADSGPERFRVDGEIHVGNNVYIGSGVIINPGIEIGDSINIGGNSTVSKSLLQSGMYVSQPLRYLPKNYDNIKNSLVEVKEKELVEKVFEKPVK